jgi:murein tripeptide amidase MpaA
LNSSGKKKTSLQFGVLCRHPHRNLPAREHTGIRAPSGSDSATVPLNIGRQHASFILSASDEARISSSDSIVARE